MNAKILMARPMIVVVMIVMTTIFTRTGAVGTMMMTFNQEISAVLVGVVTNHSLVV